VGTLTCLYAILALLLVNVIDNFGEIISELRL